MQILNLTAMVSLLIVQVTYIVSWAANERILTICIVQIYLTFPIKILFIVIAKKFGSQLTVQCHVTATGLLVVRGIDE